MASNSFGTLFRITTWGESHGPAIGVVIDGCPAGLEICEEIINEALSKRAPGKDPRTSPRKEPDICQLLSGVFEGKTTGAPISIMIPNVDARPKDYSMLKEIVRPGHANFTYIKKYGIFDHRGGGRASARETACRVAAGAVANALLKHNGVEISARLDEYKKPEDGNSVGGVVSFSVKGMPTGLGDPVYEKLEAKLASGLMSIPATKGFEIGAGFAAATMSGSEHNQRPHGVLGGISTGLDLEGSVAFKPTSSIKLEQKTITLDGEETTLKMPENSRHDPCVAIRGVPVVEAMVALVLADTLLMGRSACLNP